MSLELKLDPPAPERIFTTGQIAKICQVAPRTVSKWCDTGALKHYRIPGSNDRRVYRSELVGFMKKHGMRLTAELQDAVVLSFGLSGEGVSGAVIECDAFKFGAMLRSGPVGAVVVGDADGQHAARAALCAARTLQPNAVLVVVVPDDQPQVSYGDDVRVVRRPVDWAGLTAELAAGHN